MATDVKVEVPELPVPVLKYPHWRVNFRPDQYDEDRIPTLSDCLRIVEQNRLSLRGWDFPQVNPDETHREYGPNWIASWANFLGEIEYWRFYQSGQFLHLHALEEAVNPACRSQLQINAQHHLRRLNPDMDWSKVPGYVSFLSFFYRIIEIFEFASRLCQRRVYERVLHMNIELRGVQGFILTTDSNRSWSQLRRATSDDIGRSWVCKCDLLVSDSAEQSLQAALWFFERFGWLDPSVEILRQEQQNFLQGKR